MKINRKTKLLFIVLFFTIPLFAFSQNKKNKIIRVEGSAQVKMESSMSLQEAKEKAIELAKINALENAFGTYVEQQSDMTVANGQTDYNIIGTTKVKGEWIETDKITFSSNFKTEKTGYGTEKIRWITCNIKGKARRVVPKAQIEFEILNAPDIASRTLSFYDGEQLYVWFKSPVDGYLSIFLEAGQTVYRLLPYVSMDKNYHSGVPVKSDSACIFFAPETNAFENYSVDEMVLNKNDKPVEYDYRYLVFSEEKFVKPVMNNTVVANGKKLPRSLSSTKFQQWLANQRASSTSFQDRKIKISIRTKKY